MGLYKEDKMYGRDLFYSPIYPSPLLCFIFEGIYQAGLWGALLKVDPRQLHRLG
jgi:hypothetical protein